VAARLYLIRKKDTTPKRTLKPRGCALPFLLGTDLGLAVLAWIKGKKRQRWLKPIKNDFTQCLMGFYNDLMGFYNDLMGFHMIL
jgi:hypothetical protein